MCARDGETGVLRLGGEEEKSRQPVSPGEDPEAVEDDESSFPVYLATGGSNNADSFRECERDRQEAMPIVSLYTRPFRLS